MTENNLVFHIHSDWLSMNDNKKGTKFKKLWFILTHTELTYSKEPGPKAKKKSISLDSIESVQEKETEILLKTKERNRVITLDALDIDKKNIWVQKFKSVMPQLFNENIVHRSSHFSSSSLPSVVTESGSIKSGAADEVSSSHLYPSVLQPKLRWDPLKLHSPRSSKEINTTESLPSRGLNKDPSLFIPIVSSPSEGPQEPIKETKSPRFLRRLSLKSTPSSIEMTPRKITLPGLETPRKSTPVGLETPRKSTPVGLETPRKSTPVGLETPRNPIKRSDASRREPFNENSEKKQTINIPYDEPYMWEYMDNTTSTWKEYDKEYQEFIEKEFRSGANEVDLTQALGDPSVIVFKGHMEMVQRNKKDGSLKKVKRVPDEYLNEPYVWEYENPDKTWTKYDPTSQKLIEMGFRTGKSQVDLKHVLRDGIILSIHLKGVLAQRNQLTGGVRIIRRIPSQSQKLSKVPSVVIVDNINRFKQEKDYQSVPSIQQSPPPQVIPKTPNLVVISKKTEEVEKFTLVKNPKDLIEHLQTIFSPKNKEKIPQQPICLQLLGIFLRFTPEGVKNVDGMGPRWKVVDPNKVLVPLEVHTPDDLFSKSPNDLTFVICHNLFQTLVVRWLEKEKTSEWVLLAVPGDDVDFGFVLGELLNEVFPFKLEVEGEEEMREEMMEELREDIRDDNVLYVWQKALLISLTDAIINISKYFQKAYKQSENLEPLEKTIAILGSDTQSKELDHLIHQKLFPTLVRIFEDGFSSLLAFFWRSTAWDFVKDATTNRDGLTAFSAYTTEELEMGTVVAKIQLDKAMNPEQKLRAFFCEGLMRHSLNQYVQHVLSNTHELEQYYSDHSLPRIGRNFLDVLSFFDIFPFLLTYPKV